MALNLQLGVALRNAMLNQLEGIGGTSAKLRVYTGTQPVDCATAASGTLLVEMALPSDWMNAASGGAVTKNGTWTGTAGNTGTPGYARIVDNAGTTCHLQGTVGTSGTDFIIDTASITTSQVVTCTGFALNAPNP